MSAAKRFKFEPVVVEVNRTEELAVSFNEMLRRKPDVLYAPALAFINSHRAYLVERTLEARLPLVSGIVDFAEAGTLLSYGSGRLENFRRTAALVDKILKGANPGELPVEQPDKYQLIVNMKTAKAIGVTLSPAILQRADEVIEW